MQANEQLKIFNSGYMLNPNPWLWSSDPWLLHQAGLAYSVKGCSRPVKAKKSRGYTVRVATLDNDFIVKFSKNLETATVERL
jgi:hypothetical protein